MERIRSATGLLRGFGSNAPAVLEAVQMGQRSKTNDVDAKPQE